MACDPALLLEQARCINACIPQGMMPAVNMALLCAIASGAFPEELLSGLINYWKLEESSGNSRLDSIGTKILSEASGAVGSAPGKHAISASFPSSPTDSYLRNLSFVLPSPWSVAVWANVTSFAGGHDLMEIFDGGITGPYFTISAAGVLNISNGTDGLVISKSLGATGAWHLVVFKVLSNGTYSISVDNSAFTSAVAGTPPAPSAGIYFGTAPTSGGTSYLGLLDEIAVWSRAISQSEVATLWNDGAGRFLL